MGMETNTTNNTILKVLYLTIVMSIIFKNTEKILPQIPNIIPSVSDITSNINKNVSIIPLGSLSQNLLKSIYKYLIIFFLAFIISSVVFYSTYKIIKFVKNINNPISAKMENIYENNIIPNINLKIIKKQNEEKKN